MFTRDILPEIKKAAGGAVILSRTLHTFGLGESSIAEKLGDLMRRDRNPSVGTTVSGGVVSLRVNARFPLRLPMRKSELAATDAACRAALGELILRVRRADAPGGRRASCSVPIRQPQKWAPAVCTAESCTGGLLAKMLTDIAGSSAYFRQGYVTYSNEAKTIAQCAQPRSIAEHGAVSEPVVRAMALAAQSNPALPTPWPSRESPAPAEARRKNLSARCGLHWLIPPGAKRACFFFPAIGK